MTMSAFRLANLGRQAPARPLRARWNLGLLWATWPILAALSAGCKGAGPDGGHGQPGSGGTGPGSGSFLGAWSGTFSSRGSDGTSGLRDTPAAIHFVAQDDRSGAFDLSLSQVKNAVVKGSYRNFADRSLLFDIKESNVSTIGATGSRTKLDFELVGDSLSLRNDRVELTLIRDGNPDDSGGSGSGGSSENGTRNSEAHTANGAAHSDPKASDPYLGFWSCVDRAGNTWKLHLREHDSFTADIFAPAGDRSPLWIDGSFQIGRGKTDADAILTVVDSNFAKYKGLELRVNRAGDTTLSVRRMGQEAQAGTVAEVMNCDRSS